MVIESRVARLLRSLRWWGKFEFGFDICLVKQNVNEDSFEMEASACSSGPVEDSFHNIAIVFFFNFENCD